MASPELDETLSRSYELDSTDGTVAQDDEDSTDGTVAEDDDDSTDGTVAEDDDDSTDGTVAEDDDKKVSLKAAAAKIPASDISVRDIAVEAAPPASLPADKDAAFGQWLAGSRLAPRT